MVECTCWLSTKPKGTSKLTVQQAPPALSRGSWEPPYLCRLRLQPQLLHITSHPLLLRPTPGPRPQACTMRYSSLTILRSGAFIVMQANMFLLNPISPRSSVLEDVYTSLCWIQNNADTCWSCIMASTGGWDGIWRETKPPRHYCQFFHSWASRVVTSTNVLRTTKQWYQAGSNKYRIHFSKNARGNYWQVLKPFVRARVATQRSLHVAERTHFVFVSLGKPFVALQARCGTHSWRRFVIQSFVFA